MYNHLRDPKDPFWQWLLHIRRLLRFILSPKLTESQLNCMNETIEMVMNTRIKLTKVDNREETSDSVDSDEIELSDEDEFSDEVELNDETKKIKKIVPKCQPPIRWKEHFLSHLLDDYRQLAPLVFLNTDRFESKAINNTNDSPSLNIFINKICFSFFILCN
jgi:hypothetical protein